MPKLLSALVLCGMTLLAVTGCTSANRITQDYKPDTNFSQYKSFSWHNYASDVAESDQIAVQKAVEKALEQKGLRLVKDNSDLLLDLNIIKQRSSDAGNSRLGVSIGLPLGNHGAIGLGTNRLLGSSDQVEGLLVLDITERDSNQVIWRGSAASIPMSYFFIRNQLQLNAVIQDVLNQFPPK